jgi:hypothetical protein
MPPQVMTQQLRALPAKHGRFVRSAYDRFGGLTTWHKPYKQASVPIGALKDGGR